MYRPLEECLVGLIHDFGGAYSDPSAADESGARVAVECGCGGGVEDWGFSGV